MQHLAGKLIFAVLALVFPGTNSALAENHATPAPVWEFTGKYLPTYDKLRDAGDERLNVDCDRWPDVLYENYAVLFPDFRPLMNEPGMRKRWRISLVQQRKNGIDGFNFCFYRRLQERWLDVIGRYDAPKTVFCGVIANNLTPKGKIAANALEELALYGFSGSTMAMVILMDPKSDNWGLRLNSDVRYYMQLLLDSLTPPAGELRDVTQQYLTPSAANLLTGERRLFVEAAFESRDYQSVLDTTQPC